MSLGIGQLFLILIIILVLFGAGRLPKIMSDLAKGLKSFKNTLEEEDKTNIKKTDNIEADNKDKN